jgi:hypothetical protein
MRYGLERVSGAKLVRLGNLGAELFNAATSDR